MIAGDLALQPGCDVEPRYGEVRYLAGGLQPALTLKTPLERDPWSGAGWPKYAGTAACGDRVRLSLLDCGEFDRRHAPSPRAL